MAKRDYYDILGVTRTASADEIKKAHRKLARQYHPDMNKENASAVDRFKEVQEAYDVLSDDEKRRQYDQFGHAGIGGAGQSPGSGGDPFEAFRRAQQQQRGNGRQYRTGPGVGVEEQEGAPSGDFSDIFDQLFGAGRGGRGRAAGPRMRPEPEAEPQRGADVEHAVTLSFEQAARGTTLPLQISRDGKIETIDVKIPPGVKEGSRIRIKGRGQQAPGGAGDLYIVTHVREHAYFRREDLDLIVDVPLTAFEAILGAKVTVPTLDGPSVSVTIPPAPEAAPSFA